MPSAVLFWIWFCAYLNCAGWALSGLHQLNAGGYAVALAVGAGMFFVWKNKTSAQIFPRAGLKKLSRRFRRPFPLAFLILAAMAFLGGALHAPNNYDALAYRVPRVLHWLDAGHWQWIHTVFPRVNTRACGIEWLSAPFVALTRTDRLLFLINIASFLLLPGLVFSVFTRLGVRRRVAWHWMWIAPTGYGFLLQAGSIANDLFGAPFALAAVDFALRAKISRSPRDLYSSLLAAMLLTSAKASNLPLLLPWAIAILPSLKLFFRRPASSLAVGAVAVFASLLPTAILDVHYCGDWSGVTLEGDQATGYYFLRTGANVALMAVENLTPPIFPPAGLWNRKVQEFMPAGLNSQLHQAFVEPEGAEFHADEMQIEDEAGIGFGVTALLLASVAGAACRRDNSFWSRRFGSADAAWKTAILFSPWISALTLLSQSTVYPIARIFAPYYLLMIPALLVCPAQEGLVKKGWWRASAFVVFLLAAVLLVLSPARPLFPLNPVLGEIKASAARHPALVRVETVYSVFHERNDAFAPARDALPAGLKVLGLVTYDDPEASLWRPFGSRRIIHVCPGDTAADLKASGVEYILVKGEAFGKWFPAPMDEWLKKLNARIVKTIPLQLRAASGPADWYLVKLDAGV
ncbi:MAG TPA: hypothetical protein VMV89_11050 [Candidatus Paceibacterota bacterium]|nr:hypothetical protein [Candidatus Paceibacterota bacterium]